MAGNRLAQILEKEYQSQGLIGGIGSAMGKRVREKMDIRNALFSGSSISGAIGRKIFGKGYSATSGSSSKSDALTSNIGTTLSEQSEELKTISISSKITAKNTLALPSMARDMFLVKQNIIKLVKLNKGTPQTKAGDWFSRQSAREASFDKKFQSQSNTPTKTKGSTESSGGGFLGFIGSLLSSLTPSSLTGLIGGAAALAVAFVGLKDTIDMVIDLAKRLYNWVAGTEIGAALGLKPVSVGGSGGQDKSIKDQLKEYYAGTLAKGSAVLGGVAAVSAVHGASKLGKATVAGAEALAKAGEYSAKAKSASKIADVAKASSKVLSTVEASGATSAISGGIWKRFCMWLSTARPLLWRKLGLKLLQMAALASVPVAGWIMAAVQLGLSVWLAYDLYEAWKEFNKIEEGKATPATSDAKVEQNSKELEEHQSKIEELKKNLASENRPIAKANIESQIKYHQRKADEIKTAQSSNSPSAGGNEDFNFAEYKRGVGGAESKGDYNATFNNPNAVINGKPLSQNTIGEVAAWQEKNKAGNKHAAGKYQFINVAAAAKDAGLSMSDMFSAINQEKMMDAFTKINAATLKKGGFEASKENLSLAHSVGATRAVELLGLQKSGRGSLNVATDVLGWKKGEDRFDTNPHLNKSVDQVIADAGKRVGSPNYSPSGSDTGNMLASLQQSPLAPMADLLGQFDKMLNDYHQSTKGGNANFDGGKLETYNQDFMQKLLGLQGFQPNKA